MMFTIVCLFIWAGRDLNPRRQSQWIYSPPPLTTRTPTLDGVSVIYLKDITEAYPLSRHGILDYQLQRKWQLHNLDSNQGPAD